MKIGSWKRWETFWAKALGGERVPVTGRHSGDVPDVAHPYLAIEVKATSRAVSATMKKAQEQAALAGKATGKIPVVCWTQTGGPGTPSDHFVTLTLENYLRLEKQLIKEALDMRPV